MTRPRCFPTAEIGLDGWIEAALEHAPAIEIEDRYRENLREAARATAPPAARSRARIFRICSCCMPARAIEAARASTGERKALLVGLVLSHARLVTAMHGLAPVVLLDDVAAFLDVERRAALFEALGFLGAQVFMTGVDAEAFSSLGTGAERFLVTPGSIDPAA